MNRRYKIILIIVGVSLLLPILAVQWFFGNEMVFVSYQFANEYLRFIGSLISISFSFYLINVYWKDHEAVEAINQAKSILLNYTFRVINIVEEVFELLDIMFDESNFVESEKRDGEISHLIEKMQKVGLAIENTSIDSRALKDPIFTSIYIGLVWKDLLPVIQRLSSLKNFRIKYDDFSSALTEIKTVAQKIQEELS